HTTAYWPDWSVYADNAAHVPSCAAALITDLTAAGCAAAAFAHMARAGRPHLCAAGHAQRAVNRSGGDFLQQPGRRARFAAFGAFGVVVLDPRLGLRWRGVAAHQLRRCRAIGYRLMTSGIQITLALIGRIDSQSRTRVEI